MEESDPVNGWPQRALSLWDMMMMMKLTEISSLSSSQELHLYSQYRSLLAQ